MSAAGEMLESDLLRALETLGDRLDDEEFASELYRALASNAWRSEVRPETRVALSWSRSERLVNELRARRGQPALVLAQTGGEGEISPLVRDELQRLGWQADPLDTSTADPDHLPHVESPPPPWTGERSAPVDDPRRWEREAHDEAEKHSSAVRPTAGTDL